jgi:hypothetical protein
MWEFNVGRDEVESVAGAWTGIQSQVGRAKIVYIYRRMALQEAAGGTCVENSVA